MLTDSALQNVLDSQSEPLTSPAGGGVLLSRRPSNHTSGPDTVHVGPVFQERGGMSSSFICSTSPL